MLHGDVFCVTLHSGGAIMKGGGWGSKTTCLQIRLWDLHNKYEKICIPPKRICLITYSRADRGVLMYVVCDATRSWPKFTVLTLNDTCFLGVTAPNPYYEKLRCPPQTLPQPLSLSDILASSLFTKHYVTAEPVCRHQRRYRCGWKRNRCRDLHCRSSRSRTNYTSR